MEFDTRQSAMRMSPARRAEARTAMRHTRVCKSLTKALWWFPRPVWAALDPSGSWTLFASRPDFDGAEWMCGRDEEYFIIGDEADCRFRGLNESDYLVRMLGIHQTKMPKPSGDVRTHLYRYTLAKGWAHVKPPK